MELKTPVRLCATLALLLSLAACGFTRGAIAAPEAHAAAEGGKILNEGGNAVDAAVCIGFVLAVTHPEAGNLGGGGFLLVHTDGKALVVDCREVAPRAARPDMFLDEKGEPIPGASLVGPKAAGVPGSVAGYLALLKKHGTMDRARILAPAIRLAEEGFVVDQGLHESIRDARDLLARFPESARVYLPDGAPPPVGATLQQPELAKVLRSIADDGHKGFYQGWFAEQMQQTVTKHGGRITIGDLFTYKVRVRKPLRGSFGGYEVVTMPPPSSGGVALLQILDLVGRSGYEEMRPVQRLHIFAEASRRAFADRSRYFGDPDFVQVPVGRLLAPQYLEGRFGTIRMAKATPSGEIEGGLAPAESDSTCHFSVIDSSGNAVSCTTTLNGAFGCGLAVSGVLLNNEMDDFTIKAGVPNQFGLLQSGLNAIEPRKRPLSSMTPTILLKDGKPDLVLGSPGGPTIISTVAQVILNRVSLQLDLPAALAAPRIHCQWMPDEILYENLGPAEIRSLQALGHTLRQRGGPMGDVQAVGIAGWGRAVGVSDPRGRGQGVSEVR